MNGYARTAAMVGMITWLSTAAAIETTFTVDIVPVSSTTVGPGGSVSYEIVGVLGGDPGLGLALWGIDLHSSYSIPGGLPQLSPGPEMGSFVLPYGLTNPAGYGGTPMGDDWLRQIGGGQNTIGNTEPPYPIGDVVEGIGLSPVVLAIGEAHLPEDLGTYQLELSELFGNVLTERFDGDPPVYHVDHVDPVIGTPSLDITVVPEPATLSLLALGGLLIARRRR